MIFMYSADYQTRYPIANVISVTEKAKYNDTGTLQLIIPMNDPSVKYVEYNGLIYDYSNDIVYEIQEIKNVTENQEVEIYGSTCEDILRRRVVATPTTIENVEADIYDMIEANLRGLLNFNVGEIKGLTQTVSDTTCYGDSLISHIQPILTSVDLGRKVTFDDSTRELTFEIYEGRDLTQGSHRAVFSEEFGTASELKTDEDVLNWFNVCYCQAKGKDDNGNEVEFVEVAGTATGADRREMWISFSGDSQAEGESLSSFRLRVKQYAALALGDYIKSQNFEVSISTSDYNTRYKLGDKVKCSSLKLNLQFDARVAGVEYNKDKNGEGIKLTLGTPKNIMYNVRR